MPLSVPHVVTKIISILPTKYKPFKSSWRRVPKGNLTIATLTTDLLQEERDLAKQGHKGSKQKEQESQSLALQAQSSRNEKDSSQRAHQKGRGTPAKQRDTTTRTTDNTAEPQRRPKLKQSIVWILQEGKSPRKRMPSLTATREKEKGGGRNRKGK